MIPLGEAARLELRNLVQGKANDFIELFMVKAGNADARTDALIKNMESKASEVNASWFILRTAVGEARAREESFWLTELGRAIALRIGYIEATVPRKVALNVLGVTKQRLSQLEIHGRLSGTPAGVDRDSLRKELLRRTEERET